MTDHSGLLQALLREDLYAFAERAFLELHPGTRFSPNWHYEHICHMLNRVACGEIKRLIINVPPRSGKSVMTSIAWPMFLMGHDPTKKIICISYAEKLAREFSVGRRTIFRTRWYQELFPRMRLTSARPPALKLHTTEHGYVYAAGVGGGVLGYGADVIVVDDPMKALAARSEAERRRVAEFFDNTLIGRLNEKTKGAIVIVMQRLHEDDLAGHALERGDWEVVRLPAIASEDTVHALSYAAGHVYTRRAGEVLHAVREPLTILEDIRRVQGSLVFEAQYQQSPAPAGGFVVKREWLRWYDAAPETFEKIVVSWDTASTLGEGNDYSVGTVWGVVGLDCYLLDVVRARFEPFELGRRMVELARLHAADTVLIENTELGRATLDYLRRAGELRPILWTPQFDKVARLEAQSARFESGQVHLPRQASWLGEYVAELLAFPHGKHDDQVDSTSQALHYLHRHAAINRPMVRRNLQRRSATRRRVVAEGSSEPTPSSAQAPQIFHPMYE